MFVKQCRRYLSDGVKSAVKVSNAASSKSRPVAFERSFPVYQRKKAWERDGDTKDNWFRRKYAHVHAREKGKGDKHLKEKKDAHLQRTRQQKHEFTHKHELHRAKYQKENAYQGLKPNPLVDYVYGTNSVLVALQARKREYFSRLLHHGPLNPKIASVAKDAQIQLEETDKHRLNILTDYGVHNNVALEAKPLRLSEISHLGLCDPETKTLELTEMFLGQPQEKKVNYLTKQNKAFPLGIYLDEVVDPHNIGAILRSAYFLGADFVVLSRKNCAPLSPVVSKVSSGAMEVMTILSTDKPLQFVELSKTEGGWLFITSCLAQGPGVRQFIKDRSIPLLDLTIMLQKAPVMLVVGNEGNGVRTNIMQRSDYFVEIPFNRNGETQYVDSLNVGVATALLMQSLLAGS